MTILLITGSRAATPAMLDYAQRCVDRASKRGYEIIVGDAQGVDETVMNHAHAIGAMCIVYGAHGRLRRQTKSCGVEIITGDYLARDVAMAQTCQICCAVWNGKSRGTKYTFECAQRLGKEVHIRDFSKMG